MGRVAVLTAISFGILAAQALLVRQPPLSVATSTLADGLSSQGVAYLPLVVKKHTGPFLRRRTPTITNTPTLWVTATPEILTPTPSPTFSGRNIPEPGPDVYADCVVRSEYHEANGGGISRVSIYTYNHLGRPILEQQDVNGSRADGIIDHITTYRYKNQWQPTELARYEVRSATFLLGRWHYIYNSSDQLVQETSESPGSETIYRRYAYDERGRMIRKTSGGDIETRQYNDLGELIRIEDDFFADGRPDWITNYEWNDGMIIFEYEDSNGDGQIDGTYGQRYDTQRRLVYSESSMGPSTYTYDERGWLSSSNWDGIIVRTRYDDKGRRLRVDFGEVGSNSSFIVYDNTCP